MAHHVMNIAHRGAAALWPENTLEAFQAALAAGCDGLELDAQLTGDGEAVVYHDYRLNPDFARGEDGAWLEGHQPRLSTLSKAQLSRYRIGRPRPGSAYAAAHPDMEAIDAHVPSLDEALGVFARHAPDDGRLLLELKHPTRESQVRTDAAVLIARVLEAVDSRPGVSERTTFVGFNWAVMRALKRRRSGARIWLTTYPESWFRPSAEPHRPPAASELDELRRAYADGAPWMAGFHPQLFHGSIPDAVRAAGGDGWLAYGPDLIEPTVRQAQSLGLEVGVWGLDNEMAMRRWLDLEVTALCTDRPDRLARLQQRPWGGRPSSVAG